MSPIETQEPLSEDMAGASDNDTTRFVPVAESIRYRKRAQSAEKKLEVLTEQLAEAKAQSEKMSEQLDAIQIEQKLTHGLAAAGAVDLETATLIAKARMQNQSEADVDGVIEQLKKEKQYLFGGTGGSVTPGKTAGAKDRVVNNQTLLERTAKKAATTGNRADLHEYLKLRRNFL
jgi:multidrug resistance efflux pump